MLYEVITLDDGRRHLLGILLDHLVAEGIDEGIVVLIILDVEPLVLHLCCLLRLQGEGYFVAFLTLVLIEVISSYNFV